MTTPRRTFLKHSIIGLFATATFGLSAASPLIAQSFPEKPLTMVVAWPAGGGHDTVGRLVADYLSAELSQPVVVVNQPGAAGTTGVRAAANADPDGYTIGVMGLHVVAQTFMNENAAPYSTITPLALIEKSPAALSVRTDSGIEDLAGFIEMAKAESNAILNSNDGPGGFANITAMLVQNAIGTEFATIPYQGYAPAIAAIASGETNASTVPTAQMLGLADGGDVKIIAIAGNERHFRAPDVPTFIESGVPFVFGDFVGLFLPADVPTDRLAILESAMMSVLANEEFLKAAMQAGLIISPEGSEAFGAFLAEQDEKIYPVLEDSGLVVANER